VKERRSWSGKKKINSYKLLSVMDHSRHYIFACICLGKNDREVFTGSPLYLQEGGFFLENEFVAANGAFEGDGHLRCNFKNPGMMRQKSCGIWHFMKWELVWKSVTKELVLGFHWLEITSTSFHIVIKCCF